MDLKDLLTAIEGGESMESVAKRMPPELASKIAAFVMVKELDCIGHHFRTLLKFPRDILERNLSTAEDMLPEASNRVGAYVIVCFRSMFEEFKKAEDASTANGNEFTRF